MSERAAGVVRVGGGRSLRGWLGDVGPALVAGGAYLGVAEVALRRPDLLGTALSAADTLSLLTGAVTAAALSGVYLQVKGARRDAEERARQQQAEAAVRADELQAQFHAHEMVQQRIIALQFLKYLRDASLMDKYAEIWVSDSTDEIDVAQLRDGTGQRLTYSEQSWALEVVIAFFVRVGTYLDFHQEQLQPGSKQSSRFLEPFCWSYWKRGGMLEFMAACERAHWKVQEQFARPYFLDKLQLVETASSY